MLIQEEYAARHRMALSMVNYTVADGLALLRPTASENPTKFGGHVLITVKWVPHDRHPGVYSVSLERPCHDSYGKGAFFVGVCPAITYQYEEFEPGLRRTIHNLLGGYRAISCPIASQLFLWENFVCCFDGWLVRNGTTRLLGHTEASIDSLLSPEERYGQFEAATVVLAADNPSIYEKWLHYFYERRRRLLPWLCDLMKGE